MISNYDLLDTEDLGNIEVYSQTFHIKWDKKIFFVFCFISNKWKKIGIVEKEKEVLFVAKNYVLANLLYEPTSIFDEYTFHIL